MTPRDQAPRQPGLSTRALVAIILGGALLVALAFGVGRLTAPTVSTPSNTSAEAGFSRDMQEHHNQAVRMSMIVLQATDDPEITTLAYDIATAQQQQAGQMFGWLEVWGLPQAPSEPSMTWMSRPTLDGGDHDHGGEGASGHSHTPGEPMPGLATAEQMAKLETLEGIEAEVYFLELMIEHHMGGVEMAEAVLERSTNPVVTKLAKGMVTVQDKEIVFMNELLEARR
nr:MULTISPECIES: DUF305 domain-containing protein [unclassified Salinibacterium]